VRAVREIRRNFAKSIVFREYDFGRGQKRCWFFFSVAKNFRVRLPLIARMPFRHFPLPFKSGCYNLRPHEPGNNAFSVVPGLGWFIRLFKPDSFVTPISPGSSVSQPKMDSN
jgi:hypothetical protein